MKPIQKFKSVEQEGAFWDSHSPFDYGIWKEIPFERIAADVSRRAQRKVAVSMRLEPELVRKLKAVAKKHRLPYQALIREVLWRTVERIA